MDQLELGQELYEEFYKFSDKNFMGNDLPKWWGLFPEQKRHWILLADHIIKKYKIL